MITTDAIHELSCVQCQTVLDSNFFFIMTHSLFITKKVPIEVMVFILNKALSISQGTVGGLQGTLINPRHDLSGTGMGLPRNGQGWLKRGQCM